MLLPGSSDLSLSMNFITARALGLLVASVVVLAPCESADGLSGAPAFTPVLVLTVSELPQGLEFDVESQAANQSSARLDQKVPRFMWQGKEKDFTLQIRRVMLTKGKCRHCRVFNSDSVRAWHLREIPVSAVTPGGFGRVLSCLTAPMPDQNHYFESKGPWTRHRETWDVTHEKRTTSGRVKAHSVTLHFTTRAAA